MDGLSDSSLDENTGGGKGIRSKGSEGKSSRGGNGKSFYAGQGKNSKGGEGKSSYAGGKGKSFYDGGGKGKEGLSQSCLSVRRAVTSCLRYDYDCKMVSLDMLWRSLHRVNWCTPEMLRRYFLELCPQTGEDRFDTEMRGDELFVRARPSRRVLQETGDRRRRDDKAKRQGDAEKPSGSAAHEPKKRPSGPQQQPQHQKQKKSRLEPELPRHQNVTLFDVKAAEAAAIAVDAAEVAAAVRELAEDLKLTAHLEERWKKVHFRELQKTWHPDKNPHRATQSNIVFKYLMDMREQYLTVAASSSGATPAAARAAAGSAGATPAPKSRSKQ